MDMKIRHIVLNATRSVIIVLSLLLVVYISVDTFEGIDFLKNRRYMDFQFWVCVVFLADFFVEMWFSARRLHYLRTHFLFLFISIPYLNIISACGLQLTSQDLFFVRFIPLLRGVVAMAIVVGYLSSNRITSLLVSYMVIMLSIVYFASLIFLYKEQSVNPMVEDYGNALWWAFTTATSVGCSINPMTPTGKILAVVVACTGITMFPLFTVYFTSVVQRYSTRLRHRYAAVKNPRQD